MYFVAARVRDEVVEPWILSARNHSSDVEREVDGDRPAPPPSASFRPIADELRDVERRRMVEALAAANGVQKKAAELIGMPVRTFTLKYKQYGLNDK